MVGGALCVPLLLLTMGPMIGLDFARKALGERPALWVELAIATPVIVWAGWPFLVRATMRNIHQNLFFALVYNAAGVPIAAGILYPFFGILVSPIFAAAAMSLSSVSVIGNALRLRRVRI